MATATLEATAADVLDVTVTPAEAAQAAEIDAKVSSVVGAAVEVKWKRELQTISRKTKAVDSNPKRTRENVDLGETYFDFVTKYTKAGMSATEVRFAMTEQMLADGCDPESIKRVPDRIAVYKLAVLCTGESRTADMPKDWLESVAYRTLAYLKVGVNTDAAGHGSWADGWKDFVLDAIRTGATGKALIESIKAHREYLQAVAERNKRSGMNPSQIAMYEQQQLQKQREKDRNAFVASIQGAVERAVKAGFRPDELSEITNGTGSLPPIQAPVDFAGVAHKLDPESVVTLANAIIERGNVALATQLAGLLKGWLMVVNKPAEAA